MTSIIVKIGIILFVSGISATLIGLIVMLAGKLLEEML